MGPAYQGQLADFNLPVLTSHTGSDSDGTAEPLHERTGAGLTVQVSVCVLARGGAGSERTIDPGPWLEADSNSPGNEPRKPELRLWQWQCRGRNEQNRIRKQQMDLGDRLLEGEERRVGISFRFLA